MKRLLFLVVLVEVLAVSSTALASPGAKIWAKRYNGPGNFDDNASVLGVSPDGATVYITGFSTGSTTGKDYATIAYNETAWAREDRGIVGSSSCSLSPSRKGRGENLRGSG